MFDSDNTHKLVSLREGPHYTSSAIRCFGSPELADLATLDPLFQLAMSAAAAAKGLCASTAAFITPAMAFICSFRRLDRGEVELMLVVRRRSRWALT